MSRLIDEPSKGSRACSELTQTDRCRQSHGIIQKGCMSSRKKKQRGPAVHTLDEVRGRQGRGRRSVLEEWNKTTPYTQSFKKKGGRLLKGERTSAEHMDRWGLKKKKILAYRIKKRDRVE